MSADACTGNGRGMRFGELKASDKIMEGDCLAMYVHTVLMPVRDGWTCRDDHAAKRLIRF